MPFDLDLWPFPINATKCYSFAISNPISILCTLCDSTRWELQNFYTEFWPLSSLTFNLDFIRIMYTLLQNTTPMPFLTRFRFCLLYVIALIEGFKTSTQNFDNGLLWPLTLILYYIINWLQNATPLLFLTPFRFCLLDVIALGEGFRNSTQNFDLCLLWPMTLTLYCTFCYKMLLLCHFQLNFDVVHIIYVIALSKGLKYIHRILIFDSFDLWPWFLSILWIGNKNATPRVNPRSIKAIWGTVKVTARPLRGVNAPSSGIKIGLEMVK